MPPGSSPLVAVLLALALVAGCSREAPLPPPRGLQAPAPDNQTPQAIELEQRPEVARVLCDDQQRIVALFFQRRLVTDATLDIALEAPTIESLDLVEMNITDAACAKLAKLPNLQTLHLKQTPITDAGLADLVPLTSLRTLSLARTNVTDAGCVHLARLVGLEELQLDETAVTDAGLDQLATLPRLKLLTLVGAPVTDAGVARLQAALPELEVVR